MYRRIMVPLDGSGLAECVLPHAEALSKGEGTKEIILVRVVEPFYIPAGGDYSFSEGEIQKFNVQNLKAAQDYMTQVTSKINPGAASVRTEVLSGSAAEILAEYANKNNIDLVVLATHGRSGVSRWVMGSIADRLLHSVNAPVLMVRAPGCGLAS
jgi:nucleotide-binding universal stress UspA family protein